MFNLKTAFYQPVFLTEKQTVIRLSVCRKPLNFPLHRLSAQKAVAGAHPPVICRLFPRIKYPRNIFTVIAEIHADFIFAPLWHCLLYTSSDTFPYC